MKAFISYHRADQKYKDKIVEILKKIQIQTDEDFEDNEFQGLNNQAIAQFFKDKVKNSDVVICILGNDTYKRPFVDNEIKEALKGGCGQRKGIVAVMLETRSDRKNNIDLDTIPVRIAQNLNYIVLEQYASIERRLKFAIDLAIKKSKESKLIVTNNNPQMKLRKGEYNQHKG